MQLNPKERITAEEALNLNFLKLSQKCIEPEDLSEIEELHEYQTDKERKKNRNKLTNLKAKTDNQEIEKGNKDFIGKKRNDTLRKDVTPSNTDKKMKSSHSKL